MSKSKISNMWSFWERESFVKKADVIIVGSGIVGLNAALEIKSNSPELSVIILEAGPLPSGASTKNAGFACFGSPSELMMDLEHSSSEKVFALVEKRLKGLNYLRNLVGDKNMNYLSPGSYELFMDGGEGYVAVEEHLNFLNDECAKTIGFKPYELKNDIISKNAFQGFSKAIKINGEGQINTGEMMKALLDLASSKGIRILNGIKVLSHQITSNELALQTSHGEVRCEKCLIATNGFASELIDKTVEPARAQVLITEEIDNLPFEGTYHFDSGYYYFRNVGRRVLFGGGRNLDFDKETTSKNELNPIIQDELDNILSERILPNCKFEVAHRWTGIMGVGGDKTPYIEKLDDRLYCAVKLGGMGVAIGSTTGIEAAQLLLRS